jgi:hypothetical protein
LDYRLLLRVLLVQRLALLHGQLDGLGVAWSWSLLLGLLDAFALGTCMPNQVLPVIIREAVYTLLRLF